MSAVTIGTAADPSEFSGQISSLAGTDIQATVSSAAQTLRLVLALQISSGAASGTLGVTPSQ